MLDIIPIFGIIFGVGGPVAIIALIVIYLYKTRQLRGQEILAAIEKGIEVPFPPPKKRNYLAQGLVWTALGIALVIALWISTKASVAVWGLLPMAMGVAFLLIAYFEKKKKEKEGEEGT